MKFKDLKPGDSFRTIGDRIYLIPHFDIFAHDRVIRTHKKNAGMAIIISGKDSGKYDGVFRDADDVELLSVLGEKVTNAH